MLYSTYVNEITRLIDEQSGHSVEYPESFESDTAAAFMVRMPLKEAVEYLYNLWFGERKEECPALEAARLEEKLARDAVWDTFDGDDLEGI